MSESSKGNGCICTLLDTMKRTLIVGVYLSVVVSIIVLTPHETALYDEDGHELNASYSMKESMVYITLIVETKDKDNNTISVEKTYWFLDKPKNEEERNEKFAILKSELKDKCKEADGK